MDRFCDYITIYEVQGEIYDTFAQEDVDITKTIVYEGDTSGFPWGCPNSEVKISNDIEDLDDYDKRMYQRAIDKYNEEKNNTTTES